MFSIRLKVTLLALSLLSGCAGSGPALKDLESVAGTILGTDGGALSSQEIALGLREALKTGSEQVVSQLGRNDGFNADPIAHIPLPTSLAKVREVAVKLGLNSSLDSLETRLNRAAEVAAPRARDLFLGAIQQMTLQDARAILKGPDNAATEYFRRTTGDQLAADMRPIVDQSLSQVGAVRAFNDLKKSYDRIPLAPKVSADLTGHVVDGAMDGIFYYLAQEERAIRENPLKRTSEILQRVFGAAGG